MRNISQTFYIKIKTSIFLNKFLLIILHLSGAKRCIVDFEKSFSYDAISHYDRRRYHRDLASESLELNVIRRFHYFNHLLT